MKKKTKITVTVLVILVFILFVPIPTGVYKDGGTRVYSALTYKLIKWQRLSGENDTYKKNSVYWFPNNFNTIDELWETERSNRGH